MKKIWSVLRGILAFIGFTIVAFLAYGGYAASRANPPLPDRIVLSYTLNGTPADKPVAPAWVSRFMPVEPTLNEVTSAIYRAAKDKRVEELVIKMADGDYDWPRVQDLRAAVKAFGDTGKATTVYAESYGDVYPGMAEYYLASAFDHIWIQPIGSVSITGFHAEAPYFKAVLDKMGIQPEIIQKGTYKTAPESALLDHMSAAQRESIHGVLSSMTTDFFDAVSAARGIKPAEVGSIIDGAPYTADEAKNLKLVDTVGYVDELIAKLVPDTSRELVDAVDYYYSDDGLETLLKKESKHPENNHSVAVVYLNGMIVSGTGGDGFGGQDMAYADDISEAIVDASNDPAIGAIVLRVDSPGGSPSASETIRRAIVRAKTKGKYVVVSMGNVAASGGYWVSVDADKIFAQNGTLTGSIGVFGGKANLAGLWEKLGVNWEGVELGANASMWSMNKPYSDAQRESVNRILDNIYDAFVARVANGRHFGRDVIEGMAQGRVWTGRQAKDRGLIDDIGGLQVALEDVAKKLGAQNADHLNVIELPQATDPFSEIRSVLLGGVQSSVFLKPVLAQLALFQNPVRGITYVQGFAKPH